MAITISEKAAKEIHRIMTDQKMPDGTFLRVAVKGGGCSGFSYDLSFDAAKRPHDEEFSGHGVRVLADMKSYILLNGSELTFTDGIMNRQFLFNNPQAKRSCGCGTSFGV